MATHKLMVGRDGSGEVVGVAAEAAIDDARKLARMEKDLVAFRRKGQLFGVTYAIEDAEYLGYDSATGKPCGGFVAGKGFHPFRLIPGAAR